LRDATGLDFGDRSWICNAAPVATANAYQKTIAYACFTLLSVFHICSFYNSYGT